VPGVYYFHDAKGKVIYVGKAKSLKQRVVSHFTGLNTGKKRQDFLRNIYAISFKECATEFTASLFESIEIKRLWPVYNISQKNFEQRYGIYAFEDSKGYWRLAIDKKRKYFEPLQSFYLLNDAYRTLWKLVNEYNLHAALCFLDKSAKTFELPDKEDHNKKIQAALAAMSTQKNTYAIFEEPAFCKGNSCVLIEKGKFYGMGLVPEHENIFELDKIKTHLTQYPENEIIYAMIQSYMHKNPLKVLTMQ